METESSGDVRTIYLLSFIQHDVDQRDTSPHPVLHVVLAHTQLHSHEPVLRVAASGRHTRGAAIQWTREHPRPAHNIG